MSNDNQRQKTNELVHSEAPKHSEPHFGHEGTNYEGTDARAGLVLYSLALIGGVLVIVFAFTVGIQKHIQKSYPFGNLPSALAPERVLPPAPQIQVHPWEDLPQMRAREEKVLTSSGMDAAGHFHIPIGTAITAVVARLKIEPGAPQGLITPGGGRNYGSSLSETPAPQQGPSIQGEIEKHAR